MRRPLPEQSKHRLFLLEMLPKCSIGAEIGVHLGDFSQQVVDTLAPAQLHLIDPWAYQGAPAYKAAWYGGRVKGGQAEMDARYSSVLDRFAANIREGQVSVHRDYSGKALLGFPDAYFDWVYIDGNHLYEYVKRDLALSVRKVRSGGYIAGDDYQAGGWWGGGVKKAVDELARDRAVHWVELRNRQFILRRT